MGKRIILVIIHLLLSVFEIPLGFICSGQADVHNLHLIRNFVSDTVT